MIFSNKDAASKKIWFCQVNLARSLSKINPLDEKDLTEFLKLQKVQELAKLDQKGEQILATIKGLL